MKIAFDVHGTIGQYPHIFKPVMDIMMQSGIEVCVLSGPPFDEITKELVSLEFIMGKHFATIYSVVDFLREDVPDLMTQDDLGRWWTDDKIWWSSKGKICSKYDIGVLIDNELKYKPFMVSPTKFIHWDRKKV